jgi:hypothetical protein
MRWFLIFTVCVGLGALYLWQKHHQAPTEAAPQPVAVTRVTPAPSTTVSEHDWMKRSLDRAAEVAGKARKQTQEAQDP